MEVQSTSSVVTSHLNVIQVPTLWILDNVKILKLYRKFRVQEAEDTASRHKDNNDDEDDESTLTDTKMRFMMFRL